MRFDRDLRRRITETYKMLAEHIPESTRYVLQNPELLDAMKKPERGITSNLDVMHQMELESLEISTARWILHRAKSIVFSREQAEVFMELAPTYAESLEFRLPFECVYLQFDQPLPIDFGDGPDVMVAILLQQFLLTEEINRQSQEDMRRYKAHTPWHSGLNVGPASVGSYINHVIPIFEDGNLRKLTWSSERVDTLFEQSGDDALNRGWQKIRNLAIACIGYVNCENVYLKQEGVVEERINRKRERDGKKRLEPYYVCRLRGVQYDSEGREKGQGAEHGFRYDVRGHFRHLSTGKTTWVRPHQRGLQHELYIPKTYLANHKEQS